MPTYSDPMRVEEASLEAQIDLLIATTVAIAVGTGATLDQTIKQLPARRRVGASAYVAYVRAADLRNGLIWYPVIGVSCVLTPAAAIVVGLSRKPTGAAEATLIALAVSIVGFIAATATAAPTLFTVRRGAVTDLVAARTLDRFARMNAVRAVAITLALVASTWALVATVG